MLAYRVTPRGCRKLSLAEAITQCKFRVLLLIKPYLYAPVDDSREVMSQQKQKQAEYYDHTAQQLPDLQQNQSFHLELVLGQPTRQRTLVTRMPTNRNPRAYHVQISSRNRRFICLTVELASPGPITPEVPVALS